jgi:hypothetical protein
LPSVRGGCHCGNLTYSLEWPQDEEMRFRKCACSFCTKHGAIYIAHPRAALFARVRSRGSLSRYTFATGTAEFFVCARCGVAPWVASVIGEKTYAVVNAATFDVPAVTGNVPSRSHEEESVERRLARRKRSWIADVEIAFVGE